MVLVWSLQQENEPMFFVVKKYTVNNNMFEVLLLILRAF